MRIVLRLPPLPILLLLLGACAGGPTFDTSEVDSALTPAIVIAGSRHTAGKQVLWGGIILATTNLPDNTLIEMLAYPLNSRGKPQRDEAPQGRFFLEQGGFLDPAVYAAGRLLTASGTILRIETGKVGAAEQSGPVVSAEELHLWPVDSTGDDPVMIFGVGFGFGF